MAALIPNPLVLIAKRVDGREALAIIGSTPAGEIEVMEKVAKLLIPPDSLLHAFQRKIELLLDVVQVRQMAVNEEYVIGRRVKLGFEVVISSLREIFQVLLAEIGKLKIARRFNGGVGPGVAQASDSFVEHRLAPLNSRFVEGLANKGENGGELLGSGPEPIGVVRFLRFCCLNGLIASGISQDL